MDSILYSRLKSFLAKRLEVPNVVVNEVNYIQVLSYVAEYVEALDTTGLSGVEKKTLVLDYYRRLISEAPTGVQLMYPNSDGSQAVRNDHSKLLHFCEYVAGNVLDAIISATKGLLNINNNNIAVSVGGASGVSNVKLKKRMFEKK